MRKNTSQLNKVSARPGAPSALQKARKRLYWQAGLAVVTILLTAVMMFAMSAAWYTNIVQTSGLVFQAAAWGFDGKVTVTDTPIQAAPGENGVIHLEVENQSDSISAISVDVTKTQMTEEMQKRLYFYVDAAQTRNEETMDRVYLNSNQNYTYTVFNDSALTLTEAYHNDAPLKWQWVYDVLGYYVMATESNYREVELLNTDGSAALDENGAPLTAELVDMQINEYLRPIEYDYDAATTTFVTDEQGRLTAQMLTVDGETTVEEFLAQLSAADGYAGVIDPKQKNPAGYYPVAVTEFTDETTGETVRTGVWAYLCSYSEIELNTRYDTALGNAAAEARAQGLMTPKEEETTGGEETGTGAEPEETLPYTYVAQLSVSAQRGNIQALTVNTVAGLQSALTDGVGNMIRLNSNLSLTQPLTVPDGRQVTLDLNGKTLTLAGDGLPITDDVAIDAQPGSAITVVNGVIDGGGAADTYAVKASGAQVTLSGVTIQNIESAIRISDVQPNNAEELDTRDAQVRLVGCDVTANEACITIMGNGSVSGQPTQLIVEKTKLVSRNYVAIASNGTSTGHGQWGTDIQILNSTLDGYWAGIYHPQKDSTLTIYNSEIIGYTGIAIKGGTVNLIDSTVTGTGEAKAPSFGGSGFSDTGDAVYIETNYGYQILLNISQNSTLSSTYGKSLQVYDAAAANVSVQITSGNFKEEQPAGYLAGGSKQESNESGWAVTSEIEQALADARAAAEQTLTADETTEEPAA